MHSRIVWERRGNHNQLACVSLSILLSPLICRECSDSYIDLAGSMNDLGVYHTALLQFDAAEKVLKRALMMTERSYEINQELYIAIIANMAEMYRAKGEIETAVLYADRLLHLLNKCFNHIYNDIKEEGKDRERQDLRPLAPDRVL